MDHPWKGKQFRDARDYLLTSGPAGFVAGMQGFFRDAMIRRLHRLLADRLPVTRMVDVGCAVGDWTLRYARQGFADEVVGFELNPEFLAIARSDAERMGLTNVRFEEADVSQSPDLDGAGLVCMGGLLQCLPEAPAEALIVRVGQAQGHGGALYVRTSVPRDGVAFQGENGSYYRPLSWYEQLFARLGYRTIDFQISAAVSLAERARWLGRGADALGKIAVVGHHAFARSRIEFVNWILLRAVS